MNTWVPQTNIKGPPGSSGGATPGDVPPSSPISGQFWWETDTGILWVWYVDIDGGQWVQVNAPGGSGGGGADLDTTPVAATGSTLERVIPDWLAGAPVIEILEDVVATPYYRGAWLHMMNDIGSMVTLTDDWLPGMAFGVRQIGIGQVQWETELSGGATIQMPFTKVSHITISEQYEEVVFRVISNVDGTSAVWGVSGGTA